MQAASDTHLHTFVLVPGRLRLTVSVCLSGCRSRAGKMGEWAVGSNSPYIYI